MAFTEKYVTPAGAGTNDGLSFANAFTFAQAITDSSGKTGQRYNLKGAFGSIGATTFIAGTFDAPNIWRGCFDVIGDCDDLGRNADGTLNTTGMPTITITGIWTMATYVTLQNLNITGALSSTLIGNNSVTLWNMISCRVENSQNNAAAQCVQGDNDHAFINVDLLCSGAAHNRTIQVDANCRFIGCRFEITTTSNCIESQSNVVVIGCEFLKRGTLGGDGIEFDTLVGVGSFPIIVSSTFYNFTNAIHHYSTHSGGSIWHYQCHATDCTYFIQNTTNIACYAVQTRTRNLSSGKSTGVEYVEIGPLDTVTGSDPSVDYEGNNSTPVNNRLKTTAEGYNAGWNGSDIGGLQTDPPASSGGGLLTHPGMSGGMRG
jgi:hypothetical protein